MTIDFTFAPDVDDVRLRVREFLTRAVKPREKEALDGEDRSKLAYSETRSTRSATGDLPV